MIGRLWNSASLRQGSSVLFRSCSSKASAPAAASDEPLYREIYQNNQVVRLVLNNPKKRNVLTMKVMDTLLMELKGINGIEKVRAVIIASEGNAFSAGHDLKELKVEESSGHAQKELFAKCTELMSQIQRMDVPVIAEVDGVAAAAGCQLVASCDIAIGVILRPRIEGRNLLLDSFDSSCPEHPS
ncbi:hypothetical protein L596_014841 [Steinernema carpocapsae]|uniref:Enoyl-CoA hydratase n=1 Tax=Steinernema carpocapsae TaxID=34508 RepID=A0A4U5NDN9_STECR|nr:hypothetical protein L596_014841 [Steinernema carpocapsae]